MIDRMEMGETRNIEDELFSFDSGPDSMTIARMANPTAGGDIMGALIGLMAKRHENPPPPPPPPPPPDSGNNATGVALGVTTAALSLVGMGLGIAGAAAGQTATPDTPVPQASATAPAPQEAPVSDNSQPLVPEPQKAPVVLDTVEISGKVTPPK